VDEILAKDNKTRLDGSRFIYRLGTHTFNTEKGGG